MKSFLGDLESMCRNLRERRPFAFSRFGDGELRILRGEPRHHPEFWFEPQEPAYGFLRDRLMDSFRYADESYHVGIPCPRCVGEEKFLWAKQTSGQAERQLTWATLLVNANYTSFRDRMAPLFSGYEVFMVCQKAAVLERLPFKVSRAFGIEKNGWRKDYHLAHRMAEFIARTNLKGALFLLCAGPFANILAHQLHLRSKDNTYLDIGSTLDPYLFGSEGMTRRYLRGEARFLRRICAWQ